MGRKCKCFKDGKTLYFSSNRNEGAGAMDLYKSVKLPNGDWGLPVNLGPKINTMFNEDSPIITEDGKNFTSSHKAIKTWVATIFSALKFYPMEISPIRSI
ncbi:MAG: hypothetical protein HC905_29690 [Bacteroidales bacterium]|nr:hypothetical protein [Bacteroidales bacterium]